MEKVRLYGDPVLRTPCLPVDLKSVDINALIDSMVLTMNAENGIGLAANQIGHSLAIFIIKHNHGAKEYINPAVLEASDLVELENEGCLSIPGTSGITKRYNNILLSWIDRYGMKHEAKFTGMEAFAVQHEMEHLRGELYIDQYGPVKKKMMLKKHKKFVQNKSRR